MRNNFDWSDLRVFLALTRQRSIRQAARLLDVSHSTVLRRLDKLEADLGARLFDRTPDGFVPTSTGERVLPHAERVETELFGMSREIFGNDAALSGSVVVTMPPPLAQHLLMPHLAAFRDLHPGIDLEIVSSYAMSDLSRREADVAIRFLTAPEPHLVGYRLPDFADAVYAAPDYLVSHDPDEGDACWIGWDNDDARPSWRAATPFPDLPAHWQIGDPLAQAAAARAGLGLSLLPCWLGDGDPDLVRVPPGAVVQTHPGWILTHPDLRTTERVRTLVRFLVSALRGHADRIAGQEHRA